MKHLTTAILTLLISTSSLAGEKIDKSLEMSATGKVSIEDINGQFEIQGWNKNVVKVTGELSDEADGYTFEKHGDGVIFEVEYSEKSGWKDWFKSEKQSKLKFMVPEKSNLNTSNVNGDIKVMDIKGSVETESVNGDITAKNLANKVSVETVNGDINISNIKGKIYVETVNGDITDEGSSGDGNFSAVSGDITSASKFEEMEIEIVNGNLELDLDEIDELSIESVNGDVDITLKLNKKGEVSISNVNGNIDLKVNKNISADFRINAFVGGKIVNKLTDDKADKKNFNLGSSLNFSKDGGSGSVEINTVSGRVKIGAR